MGNASTSNRSSSTSIDARGVSKKKINKVSSMTAQEKVEEYLESKESVRDQSQYRREPRESKRGRGRRRPAFVPAYDDETYGDLDSQFQHKPPSPELYTPEPEEPPDEPPTRKKAPVPTPKPAKSKKDKKRKKAFMKLVEEYDSMKTAKEKLESENSKLKDEIAEMIRVNESIFESGSKLDIRPEDLPNRFITLKEKLKVKFVENEDLKSRLRAFENNLLASSTTNELEVQIQRYIKQAHRQSAQIDDLSAKLTSQRKLVNLCKDQEKIITRLEDLFSKTRIDIDKKWKKEMDQMLEQAKNRPQYNELPRYQQHMAPPQPALTAPTPVAPQVVTAPQMVQQAVPQVIQPAPVYAYPHCSQGPTIQEVPNLDADRLQTDYESERYRNRVLERQLQDLARGHAKEKQTHINKIKDINNKKA